MNEIEAYIRRVAPQYGIDPDIAVRVAKSEGGLKDPYRQGDSILKYGREESYGPFQLHMRMGGVGTRALKAGIDPRKDWQGGVQYGLREASQKGWGQWFGAAKSGIGNWDGIRKGVSGPAPTPGMSLASNPVQGMTRPENPNLPSRLDFARAGTPPMGPVTNTDLPGFGGPGVDPMTQFPATPPDPSMGDKLKGMLSGINSPGSPLGGILSAMTGMMGNRGGGEEDQIMPSSIGNDTGGDRMQAGQSLMSTILDKRRKSMNPLGFLAGGF